MDSALQRHQTAGGKFITRSKWQGRISKEGQDGSQFKDNSVIDSIPKGSYIDGESIAAARFKQRFFEHTLGWNFDQTWVWDDKNDRPALRQVGVGSTPSVAPVASKVPIASGQSTDDLLTQQVKANMWL